MALKIVIIGLSLSSSWGNGHATTYRSLVAGLSELGHQVQFLERDVPWYASHRDLPNPEFCRLEYYSSVDALKKRSAETIRSADLVIIGSYVPEGVAIIDAVASLSPRTLCFYDIDTPITMAKLDRGEEEYIALRQMSVFDTYYSFSGGEVLERLERKYGARRAVALYCAVDAKRYRKTDERAQWDLGYLGTYSSDRQSTLEALLIEPARRLPHLRFVVAGPQYPADIDWPPNVERIEHLAPSEHPSFYSRQRFTLNVTRAAMIAAGWSPSVRLFEAAACRTPIISDRWRGLGEIFGGSEMLILASDARDVVAALTQIGEDQRRLLGEKARLAVLKNHTGLARARDLVADLGEMLRKVPTRHERPEISV